MDNDKKHNDHSKAGDVAKQLEDELNKMKENEDLTAEEIENIDLMIAKLKTSPLFSHRKKSKMEKLISGCLSWLMSILLYYIVYAALLGLFGQGVIYQKKYLLFMAPLLLATYQMLIKGVCLKLIAKCTKSFVKPYLCTMVLSLIGLFFVNYFNGLIYFKEFFNFFVFYLVGEILYSVVKYYYIKYFVFRF